MNHSKRISRVVTIVWKTRPSMPVEAFSNLKNLTLSYPQYNYNTINNYLSKQKKPYVNDEVRIERLIIHSRPIQPNRELKAKIMSEAYRTVSIKQDQDVQDFRYWRNQPAAKRIQAVTTLVNMMLKKNQRMDRSHIKITKLKK